MADKLTKKDLKSPDAFQSTMERVMDYVQDNKSRVIVIATAMVCAIIIALGIYFYWNQYSRSALMLYAQAQSNIMQGGETDEVTIENILIFNELIERYPYSWSGRMAHYHLGNIHYNKGDISQATEAYRTFLSKTRRDKTGVKFLAMTSLGYCYEANREYEQALKHFEESMNVYNVGFEMIGLRNIARAHEELGNKDKALDYYRKALEKTNEPAAVIFLQRKIASLS